MFMWCKRFACYVEKIFSTLHVRAEIHSLSFLEKVKSIWIFVDENSILDVHAWCTQSIKIQLMNFSFVKGKFYALNSFFTRLWKSLVHQRLFQVAQRKSCVLWIECWANANWARFLKWNGTIIFFLVIYMTYDTVSWLFKSKFS